MLTMTIGNRRRDICRWMKPTPSVPGMIRSQVTTSGLSCSTSSSASSLSRAVPTTSSVGLRDSISFTTLRM
jgi:hypothetical protein